MKDEDLEVIVGCAAAHPDRRGGQHVARACTDVMIIHKPTGIGVRVFEFRSQYKNKQVAIDRLRVLVQLYTGALRDVDRLLSQEITAANAGVTPTTIPEMFCEHANEVPMGCPCPSNCYCKTHTCR